MIAAIAAMAIALAGGASIARLANREAPMFRWLGQSLLFGLALATYVLLAFSLAGVRWSVAVLLVVAAPALLLIRLRLPRGERLHWLDLTSLAALAGFAAFATAARPWELDFIDNWGLKAKVFALRGAIDWKFLENAWYFWAHPDYPPLVPLSYDLVALASGGWNDRWLGLVSVAMAAAGLLIARSLLIEDLQSNILAAIAAFPLVFLFTPPWIGLGEGPLVVYATCAVLLIRRGYLLPGALLLGMGALCKNEGISFIAAVAIGMLADPKLRSRVVELWPAVVVPAPWLLMRAVHKLPTDLATGSIAERVVEHLRDPMIYVRLLTTYGGVRPLLALGIVIAFAIAARQWLREERLVLVTVAMQLLFYIGAYVVTPLDVAFHVRWSWDRLMWHVMPMLTYIALVHALRASVVETTETQNSLAV